MIQEIEAVVGRQLEKFDCKEKEVLLDITKVCCFEIPFGVDDDLYAKIDCQMIQIFYLHRDLGLLVHISLVL